MPGELYLGYDPRSGGTWVGDPQLGNLDLDALPSADDKPEGPVPTVDSGTGRGRAETGGFIPFYSAPLGLPPTMVVSSLDYLLAVHETRRKASKRRAIAFWAGIVVLAAAALFGTITGGF